MKKKSLFSFSVFPFWPSPGFPSFGPVEMLSIIQALPLTDLLIVQAATAEGLPPR
jgi:hypothetical protein